MTNLHTLVSIIQARVVNENQVRFDGRERLKVEQSKKVISEWNHHIVIDWHYGVPNLFCIFVDTFDDDHNAAYVYVWEEEEVLKCTLIISYEDEDSPEDPQPLPDLNKSLDDDEIAQQLVASVIDATIRTLPR